MKAPSILLFILFTITGYAQNSLNSYKYVVVPEKFEFLKDDDQYGLNSTTKQLLEQKGFVVFVGNKTLPPAVAANNCSSLKVELIQRKTFFTTYLTLQLKDCQGNILFKGKEGKSREKEFPIAYDEALRGAFASLNEVAYKYDSSLSTQPQQVTSIPLVSSTTSAPASAPSSSAPASTPASNPARMPVGELTGTLYAQATANGYQLVDTSPKKILTLLKTSVQDYYIAEAGTANGIVFKKNGDWIFEHYEDNKLISQKLEIKF